MLFANHFFLLLIVDFLDNLSSRALLCVSKAATNSVKQQSPTIYKKMRTQKAKLLLRRINAVGVCEMSGNSSCYTAWWVPLVLRNIPLPVSGHDLCCGCLPLFSREEKIPHWTWTDLERLFGCTRPCGVDWGFDRSQVSICDRCAAFRNCILDPASVERCHAEKK